MTGVRLVHTESTGSDRCVELSSKHRVVLCDALDRGANRFRHAYACPLARGRRFPVAPAQADGRRELALEELDLLTPPCGPLRVVEGGGLPQFAAQLLEPPAGS